MKINKKFETFLTSVKPCTALQDITLAHGLKAFSAKALGASIVDTFKRVIEVAKAGKDICCSLPGEEIGSFGVFVRGDITLIANEDIESYVDTASAVGGRLFDYTNSWLRSSLIVDKKSVAPYDDGRYHEAWCRDFKIVGCWCNANATTTERRYVKAIANKLGVPYKEVESPVY